MSPVRFCLCVLLSASGVLCQVTLLESGPGTVKPSEALRLTCKVTGFSITTSGYCWHWVRQPPGKGLEWLGRICSAGGTDYSASLRSRLSVTRDTSVNEYSLQMSDMRAADTATFYCARESMLRGDHYFDYWGQGTFVTVTSDPPSKPSVFPLVLCCSDPTEVMVAIGCLVTGFLPQPVEVAWSSGGAMTTGVKMFPATMQQSPSNYRMVSQLRVPASDWEKKTYSCTVKHKLLTTDVSTTVSSAACVQVHVLPPSCDQTSITELTCLVTNFSPKEGTMVWLENGANVPSVTSFPRALEEDLIHTVRSKIRVAKSNWEHGNTYTCKVTNSRSATATMVNISRCSACLSNIPAPSVYLTRPSYEDIQEGKGIVSCLVLGMDLDNVKIHWEINGQADKGKDGNLVTHPNKTESIWSMRTVTQAEWKTPRRFTCTARHPCFGDVKGVLPARDAKIQPKSPTVTIYQPSLEDLSLRDALTLHCEVANFFPDDIIVKWENNGTALSNSRYVVAPVTKYGQAFSTHSFLIIEKHKDGGDFTCVVQHEALSHVVKKTIRNVFASLSLHKPAVRLLQSSSQTLVCLAEDFSPQEIAVSWRAGQGEFSCTKLTSESLSSGRFRVICELVLNTMEWSRRNDYSCSIKHAATQTSITEKMSITACLRELPAPSLYLLRPSYESLLQGKANVTCLAVGFDSASGSFTWEIDGIPSVAVPLVNNHVTHPNKTQSHWSSHPITHEQWKSLERFTCKMRHPCFGDAQVDLIMKDPSMPVKPPTVLASMPSLVDISSRDSLTLLCEVVGFFPGDIAVTWENNGTALPKHSYTVGPIVPSGQTFSTYSLLTIQKQLYGGDFTCVVQHDALEAVVKQTISDVFAVLLPHPPNITVLQGSRPMLLCLITDFAPKDIEVSWIKGDGGGYACSYISIESLSTGRFQATCSLALPMEEWSQRESYRCTVHHKATSTNVTQKMTITECQTTTPPPLKSLKPTFKEIFLTKTASLRCVSEKSELKSVSITWIANETPRIAGVSVEEVPDSTGETSVISTLRVTAHEWNSHMVFKCKIHHDEIAMPMEFEMSKERDEPVSPKVYLLPPASEELADNDIVSLVCLVKDFYPSDIFIIWKAKDTVLEAKKNTSNGESRYTTINPNCSKTGKSCFMVSRLSIPATEWKSGTIYSCMVGHVSSEWMFTRSVDINTGRPKLVNLSLHMNDAYGRCT